MGYREERYVIVIALLCAVIIAAHNYSGGGFAALLGSYLYWLVRISIQSLLFFGTRLFIQNYVGRSYSFTAITISAILLSLVPFVLSVTAIDIVLGYPELGIDSPDQSVQFRISALLLELFYLLDNHVALCLLLSIPGWILGREQQRSNQSDRENQGTFLSAIDPPLQGDIIWVEAQEHYARITTDSEVRMVLARFSDIVRELSGMDGMQVHRSHWIARSAVVEELKQGQKYHLRITTGEIVPVSRSYKSRVEKQLKPHLAEDQPA